MAANAIRLPSGDHAGGCLAEMSDDDTKLRSSDPSESIMYKCKP